MDHFTLLFTLLYSVRVRQGVEDRLSWIPSKKWSFDVKSDYKVLVPYANIHFLWTSIWRNRASLKVAFFDWLAALEKILTMDNLRK
jgi:hypothetical protein